MIAEICLDQIADVAFFHTENSIVKRFDHLATGKETQIATILCRTRVLRIGFGQFGKTSRIGFQFSQNAFRFLFGL